MACRQVIAVMTSAAQGQVWARRRRKAASWADQTPGYGEQAQLRSL
jgi:hypothetical protein